MNVTDLGPYMLIAIVAMSISMTLIPLMIRLAPVIGMLDKPDERKVHTEAIPRVGGVGIVIGLLVPIFIWATLDPFSESLLFGCIVLLVFGALDDARDLGPVVKFLGQFIAAITIVYYGDLYVYHFPFMGMNDLPEAIGKPFTVIAIVGMINALNLSDGLDGLAGGEALLSLAAIAYMAYQYDGAEVLIIVAATIGGIFGFLRFNSHPARVFMGDSGSQTLGFILGSLVVYLSQNLNPAMSPAVPLLLLGLPIIDSIVVFTLRARRKTSLVTAAKDHLHHRLLALGFYHYESVVIIYSVQILLVITAIFLPYESDALVAGVYLLICCCLFGMLMLSESNGWTVHNLENGKMVFLSKIIRENRRFSTIPYRILEAGLSLFFIAAALMSSAVPNDVALSSAALFAMLVLTVLFRQLGLIMYRLIMFITIGFSVYLLSMYTPAWLYEQVGIAYVYFIVMTIATFATVRLGDAKEFRITPLDYLVVIIVTIIGITSAAGSGTPIMVWMSIQMVVMFYVCELVIQNMKSRLSWASLSAALSLALISARGYI